MSSARRERIKRRGREERQRMGRKMDVEEEQQKHQGWGGGRQGWLLRKRPWGKQKDKYGNWSNRLLDVSITPM